MEKIRLYKSLEKVIAHSDEVDAILGDHAFVILGKARAKLAAHSDARNRNKVTQTKNRVDHFVNLVGPAPLATENGWHTKDGGFVRGLNILKGSIL